MPNHDQALFELVKRTADTHDRIEDQLAKLLDLSARLDERLGAFESRADDHSQRIDEAAAAAATANTTLRDWSSKIDLLSKLVAFVGLGGIASFVTLLAREFYK